MFDRLKTKGSNCWTNIVVLAHYRLPFSYKDIHVAAYAQNGQNFNAHFSFIQTSLYLLNEGVYNTQNHLRRWVNDVIWNKWILPISSLAYRKTKRCTTTQNKYLTRKLNPTHIKSYGNIICIHWYKSLWSPKVKYFNKVRNMGKSCKSNLKITSKLPSSSKTMPKSPAKFQQAWFKPYKVLYICHKE